MQPDDLMTTQEVADLLRLSERTVRKMREDGSGPPITRLGGCVRYLRADVEEWVRQNSSSWRTA